jgi:hypothetical protein
MRPSPPTQPARTQAPRTLADRGDKMADAMCRIAAERGACTEADLRQEGFTRAEIDLLGDDAREEAARRQTQARELQPRQARQVRA